MRPSLLTETLVPGKTHALRYDSPAHEKDSGRGRENETRRPDLLPLILSSNAHYTSDFGPARRRRPPVPLAPPGPAGSGDGTRPVVSSAVQESAPQPRSS